ncbi:MAG: HAD family phosphatase [Candidatus Aminicenantes bacterium]|nr:HAD family phosphatase [Candidatus Aminicenantes bacterium]
MSGSTTPSHDAGYSVIFDMDGVLVDNRKFHYRAWQKFAEKHNLPFDEARFTAELFGHTNPDILCGLFGRPLDGELGEKLAAEKESLYRELHRRKVRPAPGLVPLLKGLRRDGATLAVATVAPRKNLDFVLDEAGLRPYFQVLVDVSAVRRGKPDPEIYLKAAGLLARPPERCIAVEDSRPGLQSARAAGMKVVAVTTTHEAADLAGADLIVPHFERVGAQDIRNLVFRADIKESS